MKKFLFFIFLFFCPVVSLAVEPDEILENQILEERARLISKDLRCLVCQNENIDSSNAELAKDLRVLVRERILLGDTNKEVKDFIVKRYGEYVLLNPTFSGSTIFLWISGPILFIISVLMITFRVYFNRPKRDEISKKHSAKDLKKLEAFIKK